MGLCTRSRGQCRDDGHLYRKLAGASAFAVRRIRGGARIAPLYGDLEVVAGGQSTRRGVPSRFGGPRYFPACADHACQRARTSKTKFSLFNHLDVAELLDQGLMRQELNVLCEVERLELQDAKGGEELASDARDARAPYRRGAFVDLANVLGFARIDPLQDAESPGEKNK